VKVFSPDKPKAQYRMKRTSSTQNRLLHSEQTLIKGTYFLGCPNGQVKKGMTCLADGVADFSFKFACRIIAVQISQRL
jgi:hypothetical protein